MPFHGNGGGGQTFVGTRRKRKRVGAASEFVQAAPRAWVLCADPHGERAGGGGVAVDGERRPPADARPEGRGAWLWTASTCRRGGGWVLPRCVSVVVM